MKFCPTCSRTFDDTLTFCLIDGAVLSAPDQADGLPDPTVPGPPVTAVLNPTTSPGGRRTPALSTIVSQQPPQLYSSKPPAREPEKRGKSWMIAGGAIALVLIGVAAGILGFVWLEKDEASGHEGNVNISNINLRPNANTSGTTAPRQWQAINDKASMNGERLTYYPGTTVEQCQADCDKNEKCTGFTLIRAGAYNPEDPPMCYLMSVVTEMVPHPCCISRIKN